jgi:dodecin
MDLATRTRHRCPAVRLGRECGRRNPLTFPESHKEQSPMPDRVYKKIEVTGTSAKSLEEAVESAVAYAAQTVRNMRWFEVTETRGRIDNGKVAEWQVTLKIGFAIDE